MRSDLTEFSQLEQFFIGKIGGAFSQFDMQVLEMGAERLVPGDIFVEVGTQYGRSTYVATTMMPAEVEIYAVDIFDIPGRQKFFEQTGMDKRVTYINKPSVEAAAEWDGREIAMMFIDADHAYEGVKADLEAWAPYVRSGAWIFFHDADDTSPGVEQLVNENSNTERFHYATFYREVTGHRTSMASLRKK